jgi:transposase-like protein
MARGKAHSDETRSAALAALLEGQSVPEVARKYKLPSSTVRDLKKSISSDDFAKVRAKKEESLAMMIEGHLEASLNAARNIANQTNNVEWLNKQDADKLGVFYGITTDKAIRILEAAEAASHSEQDDDA